MENSKIEWLNGGHTTNFWWGCTKVHEGCTHCYANTLSKRFGYDLWGKNNNRRRIKSAFNDLFKYQKIFEKTGKKQLVFVGSMMDIFEESRPLLNPDGLIKDTADLRNELIAFIQAGAFNGIIFLFLTKRPQNIIGMWRGIYPENVWFGTSVSSNDSVKYMEALKLVSHENRFVSIEPQIGSIKRLNLNGIKWVIQGGESGHKRRPFKIEWAYRMKEICEKQGIPYFFKQIDKIQPIPDDLNVKQFPKF